MHPPDHSDSVRKVFLTLVVSSLVLQLCVSGFLLAKAWDSYRLAVQVEFVNDVGDGIASAFPPLGLERGRVNALLHEPSAAGQASWETLHGFRALSGAGLAQSERVLSAQGSGELPAFLAARRLLADVRAQADAALALPLGRRDAAIVDQWVPKISEVIAALGVVVERVSAAHEGLDYRFDSINLMRSNAMHLRFVAGEESVRFTGLVSRGGVPPPQAWADFAKLRRRTLQAWGEQGRQGDLLRSEVLTQARSRVDVELIQGLQGMQDEILAAWAGGRPSPVSAQDYSVASTRALGTAAELLHAIAQAEKDYADALRRQAYLYLVSALLTVAVITLLGWSTARRVARKIIRPLERLAVSVRQAEQGVAKVDLEGEGVLEVQALARQLQALLRAQTEHVDVIERNRELLEHRVAERTDELVRALDDLRQTQDQLVRSAKLASLGSIVAGVAHELNTPIGNALLATTAMREQSRLFGQQVERGLRRSELDQFVRQVAGGSAIVERNLEVAATLVTRFRDVASDQVSERRRVFELAEVVDSCLTLMEPKIRASHMDVTVNIPSGIEMHSFPGALHHVISNLLLNAANHAFEGMAATESREIVMDAMLKGTSVRIVIADNGKGIPEAVLPRIFDPFFTTRMGAGGTGLGLTIVLNLVENVLGGRIDVQSSGSGTRFSLDLPLHPAPVPAGEGAGVSAGVKGLQSSARGA